MVIESRQVLVTRSRLCHVGQPFGHADLVRQRHGGDRSLQAAHDDLRHVRQLHGLLPRRIAGAHGREAIGQVESELPHRLVTLAFVAFPPGRNGRRPVDAHQRPRAEARLGVVGESHRHRLEIGRSSLDATFEGDACRPRLQRLEGCFVMADPFGEHSHDAAAGQNAVAGGKGRRVLIAASLHRWPDRPG